MTRRFSLSRSPFNEREREALKESIRNLELQLHNERNEKRKLTREVTAARLLIAIQRVRQDSRITTTASLEEEMTAYVVKIIQDREVEVLPYPTAQECWEALKT